MLNIVISKDNKVFESAFTVRKAVFVDEQGFNDFLDETDKLAYHIVAFMEDKIVGCGRLFEADEDGTYHIGRIAVLNSYRGNGIGYEIMKRIEVFSKENLNAVTLELSAQKRALDFYIKLGYETVGDEYLEENYPHYYMRKTIN